MPAIVKAQTTKQAKASYKARGRPSLTEKDQRQLERAAELENRAKKAREANKRRAEVARTKAEHEKKAGKPATKLGSQRRVDRFGFLASQFHLGAFFGKPQEHDPQPPSVTEVGEDDFEDDGLSDEELLNALGDGPVQIAEIESAQESKAQSLQPRLAAVASGHVKVVARDALSVIAEHMCSFWDELSSGTQIARELDTVNVHKGETSSSRNWSFNSGDFDDITAEDLDELDPPESAVAMAHVEADLICKPKSVLENNLEMQKEKESVSNETQPSAMLPPARPARSEGDRRHAAVRQHQDYQKQPDRKAGHERCAPHSRSGWSGRSATMPKPPNAIKGPFMPASTLYCSPDLGFTFTQLENFVDDDLQLTQALPG